MALGSGIVNLIKKYLPKKSSASKPAAQKRPVPAVRPSALASTPTRPRPAGPTAAMYSRDPAQNRAKNTGATRTPTMKFPSQASQFFKKLDSEKDKNSAALLGDRGRQAQSNYHSKLEKDGTLPRIREAERKFRAAEKTWDQPIATSGPLTQSHVDPDTGEMRFKIDKSRWDEKKYPGGVSTVLGPNSSGPAGYYFLKGSEKIRNVNDYFGRARQTLAMYANADDEQRDWLLEKTGDLSAAERKELGVNGRGLVAETHFIAPDGTKFTEDEAVTTFKLKNGQTVERKRLERAFEEQNQKIKVGDDYLSVSSISDAPVVGGKYLRLKNQNGKLVKVPISEVTKKIRGEEIYGTYAPGVFIPPEAMYDSSTDWDRVSEVRTPDGKTVVRRGDGKVPAGDAGTVGYEQSTGRGPLGLGVYDPRAPWTDKAGNVIGSKKFNPKLWAIDEALPWLIDATLQSAPYIISPQYGWISALSEALPATYGIDASDYDSETETYGGGRLTPSKQLGQVGSPVVDMFAEKLPFEFIGDKLVGSRNFLGKGLPSAVLSSAITEGFEETVSPILGNLSEDGYANWSVPKTYNETTGEWEYDTAQMSDKARAKKLLGDMLQQAAAGASVGGAIELSNGVNQRRRAYREYKKLLKEAGIGQSMPRVDSTMYQPEVMATGSRNYTEE